MTDPPHDSSALARYRLEHRIASGSAGTVFAAIDVHTERQVIVKFIDHSKDGLGDWIREARLALRLKHAHIARCVDVGYDHDHGLWALVYERSMGGSLRRAMVAEVPFTEDDTRELIREIASGLAHAHSQGVIHRDVKPENILAGRVVGKPPWRLTDFGAGRFLEAGSSAESVVGSLAYMAPEVISKSAGALSDCFSLGMVGLELSIGRIPDPVSRSRYVLEHRHRGGLSGLLSSMVEALPERRPPSLALVAAILNDGPAENYAVQGGSGGATCVLNDDLVHISDRAHSPRPYRVPGATVLLGVAPDGSPIVATQRRVVRAGTDRLVTLLAHERRCPAWGFDSVSNAAWVLEGRRVGRLDPENEQWVEHRLPEDLEARIDRGERTVGACGANGRAVLGFFGATTVMRFALERGAIETEVLELEQPIRDLSRSGGRVIGLCGDDSGCHMYDLSGPDPVSVRRSSEPADIARVDPFHHSEHGPL